MSDPLPLELSSNQKGQRRDVLSNLYFWILLAVANILFVGWIYSSIHIKYDYEAFYSAGRAFLVNPHQLFQPSAQSRAGGIWKSDTEVLPFYHLPHELILFAPLSLLSYSQSLLLWRLLSAASLVGAGVILSNSLGLPTRLTVVGSIAFVPALLCIGEGQDSALLLLILVGTYALLRKNRQELAGLLLAFGLFKPQVVCVLALALLLSRRTRFFVSFVGSAIGLLAASSWYLGFSWASDWVQMVRSQEALQPATRMVSLHGLIPLFTRTNGNASVIVLSVVLLIVCCLRWRKCQSLEIICGSAVLVGGLTAFHFHLYDATAFLLPIAILLNLGSTEWDRFAMVVFFVSPIIIFMMAIHLAGALAISVLVFLVSYHFHSRRELESSTSRVGASAH